jgi:ABC-type glycerol-3-phosphate transport system substrate-binding protein
MEATGEELRNFNSNSNINFEWGTIPFPDITTDDSASAQKPCVRGSAGLATSWWITKRAVNNNTVEGCVDLLMYLTAPEQNNRLVGDLKGGIPLNPSDDYELSDYLKPLVNQYNDDLEELNEGKRVNFSAFNSWAVLGVSYSNSFIRTMQDLDSGATNAKTACSSLAKTIDLTVKSYIVEYEYDTTKW